MDPGKWAAQKSWKECIKDDLKAFNISLHEVTALANWNEFFDSKFRLADQAKKRELTLQRALKKEKRQLNTVLI